MSTQQFYKVSTALLLAVFLIGCSGSANQPTVANPQDAPTITMVVPQTNGVGTNRSVGVVFSKPMDPATITSSSFIIAGVSGTVAYDITNKIATFKPAADLTPNTTYNATITTGARDVSGTPLAAPFTFSFSTRLTPDTSPPTIIAVNVASNATNVPLNQIIKVTFDEQMDSNTINTNTFFIQGVPGTVTYDVATQTATFTPSMNLAPNTTYTVTVTTGAKDLGGVPLATTFHLTFTTGSGLPGGGTAPVALCPFIGMFSVLAGSTVTNTGSTVITGDVGVSPGTAVTGFPPGLASGTIHKADGAAAQGQAALTAGYNDAAGRSGGTSVSGDLVGQTLTAGVYKSTSSLAETGDLTLDAQGKPDAVFIFQIASTLTTGSGSRIILANGAKACNVFWQVGSSATLGTFSQFKGTIMALTSITVTTGVNLEGRALARNGAVTLDSDVITGCNCP
ncbi:MAG TPA: ice-binding family protein [Candidatus Angelobacter sp.]|nr:ice-binding family protein [Candidatus Angelobacter sp.]